MSLHSHSHEAGGYEYLVFVPTGKNFSGWAKMHNIGHKPLKGCMNGSLTETFIINQKDRHLVEQWIDTNDKMIVIGASDARDRRPATVLFPDGVTMPVGQFGSTTRSEAMSRFLWFYDPTYDEYFTVS